LFLFCKILFFLNKRTAQSFTLSLTLILYIKALPCVAMCCRVLPCVAVCFHGLHCDVSMQSHTRVCVLSEAALAPTPTFSWLRCIAVCSRLHVRAHVYVRVCACGWMGGCASQALITLPSSPYYLHQFVS